MKKTEIHITVHLILWSNQVYLLVLRTVVNTIVALEDLISFKRKDVTFCEIGYGNTIEFKSDRTGHIEISGEIQGDAGSHILKFEFMTDQTVFPKFISELKSL